MAPLAKLAPIAHGGTLGLVAEVALALLVVGSLGAVWIKERRRIRAGERLPARMRRDDD